MSYLSKVFSVNSPKNSPIPGWFICPLNDGTYFFPLGFGISGNPGFFLM